jgi:Domain of unknown function (DUF4917)
VPSHPLDGSLPDWAEIAHQDEWQVLLLGNGLSINVWPAFDYGSLFDYASGGGLRDEDMVLFDATTNFEWVLADLGTAIRVADAVGMDTALLYERYQRVQRALGHAIRQVHPGRSELPDSGLAAIREELTNYEWIFTTSYDLVLYWAMGCSPHRSFEPFVDHFRSGGRLAFDPARADVQADEIPVYFLHGALHLVVGGTGITWKLRRDSLQTVLDQFGQPIAGDSQARPLLVTEGSAREKLRSIEANDYLSHGLSRLRERDLPIVVFGSNLSPEDQHLLDALNEDPSRPVAVALYPATKRQLASRQADIFSRLKAETLLFFDSTTHPLGSSRLCAV